jgi:manganese transport protein
MNIPHRLHRVFTGANGLLNYVGPGLLVTAGFIDPGNWASNVAAGSYYGYALLWIVTLSTLMLILLQHNAAHLGIITGLCHSEAATRYMAGWIAKPILVTAMAAMVSTAFAEIIGGAIALSMLFHLPLAIGAVLTTATALYLLFGSSYKRLERIIIGFVSLIGLSFLIELILVKCDLRPALVSMAVPSLPAGSMLIVMSVLGAVVMPHNLFLHSEVIQTRQWKREGAGVVERRMKYEVYDTIFSMVVGWAINSAMIILAAAVFFKAGLKVQSLEQAQALLHPLAGHFSALVFAAALLFAGVASSVTAGMAGGTIFSGMFGESYDVKDSHTAGGIAITLVGGLIAVFFVTDPFKALIYSQMLLSVQLPFTICMQIYLTSSRRVMGEYANKPPDTIALCLIAAIVITLNVMLLVSAFR